MAFASTVSNRPTGIKFQVFKDSIKNQVPLAPLIFHMFWSGRNYYSCIMADISQILMDITSDGAIHAITPSVPLLMGL